MPLNQKDPMLFYFYKLTPLDKSLTFLHMIEFHFLHWEVFFYHKYSKSNYKQCKVWVSVVEMYVCQLIFGQHAIFF